MTALQVIETSAHTDPMAAEVDVRRARRPRSSNSDVEKAGQAPVKPASPSFPDGGYMARMAVAGY
jgi:hypothetical protein